MNHHSVGQPAAPLAGGQPPSLSCEFCDSVGESRAGLRAHQSWHHSEQMFRCEASPACSQVFLTVRELRLHLTGCHLLQAFDCVKVARAGLVRLPRDLRLVRCGLCRAELYTDQARSSHGCGADLRYECRACEGYHLASWEKLNTHVNLKHGSWVIKTVQAG